MCVSVCVPDSEKCVGEQGNGIAQWGLNEQLFPCPVCGKVFGRQQTLSRHMSLHTGKETPREAPINVVILIILTNGISLCKDVCA